MLLSIGYRTLMLFPDGATVLAFALAALVFFSWYARRLKFVSLDGDNLHVSDLLKGGVIPISEVQHVFYSGVMGVEDAKTGANTGGRLAIWKLLSTAENEKLPFGETLPCYALKTGDYKPYRK